VWLKRGRCRVREADDITSFLGNSSVAATLAHEAVRAMMVLITCSPETSQTSRGRTGRGSSLTAT